MNSLCQRELAKTFRHCWSAQTGCQCEESPIRSIISSFVSVLRSTPSFAEVLHCACRKRPFLIRPLENTLIKLLKSLDFYNDEGRIKIAIGAQHTFSPILCVEFLQLFASAGCLVSGHPQMCSPPCHILLLSMSFHCGAWSFSGVCFCLTNPLYTPVPKTAQSAPLLISTTCICSTAHLKSCLTSPTQSLHEQVYCLELYGCITDCMPCFSCAAMARCLSLRLVMHTGYFALSDPVCVSP